MIDSLSYFMMLGVASSTQLTGYILALSRRVRVMNLTLKPNLFSVIYELIQHFSHFVIDKIVFNIIDQLMYSVQIHFSDT